jgi:hypothetical protein
VAEDISAADEAAREVTGGSAEINAQALANAADTGSGGKRKNAKPDAQNR